MLVLLSHRLLLRLSLALVAVILKPDFHLKREEIESCLIDVSDIKGRQSQTTIDFLPIGGVDGSTDAQRLPKKYETKPKTVMKSMINYISLCCGSLKPEVFFLIVFQSFEGSLGIRSLSTEYDQIGFSCVKLPFASFLPSQQQQTHKSDPGARALFSH